MGLGLGLGRGCGRRRVRVCVCACVCVSGVGLSTTHFNFWVKVIRPARVKRDSSKKGQDGEEGRYR